MKITFLGTSSGTPTRRRNVTAQAVQFDHGGLWLLDCGEATQHQLMRAGLKASRIERILLTHLHGDHCYGVFGLLSCIAIHQRTAAVEVVGPPGTGELIRTVLRLSEAHLPFPLTISELPAHGGRVTPLHGWSVEAHAINHRVTCLGYVLREDPRPGAFDPERARALGIPAGPLFRRLQHGETIDLPDGRRIAPEAVRDPARPGRVAVLLGDTSDARAIATAGHGCDVLVCETTYAEDRTEKAAEWGHSTTAMTGELAALMAAKTLIITHFSSRYTEPGSGTDPAALARQTQRYCPDTQVLAADDLWTFVVEPP